MRILITGVCGFVGSTVASKLAEKHDILGIDDLSYGYIDRIKAIEQNIDFRLMPVEKLSQLEKSLEFDIILNCAAIAPLPENQVSCYRSLAQNVASCGALVDFCLDRGVKKIVHFSSSAIYENSVASRIGNQSSETDFVSPRLMYPISKQLSEVFFQGITRSYSIDVTCIRLFNLYGPNQDYFRKQPPLLGYLLRNILEEKPITVYASRNAKRDYIYISDLIRLLTKIFDSPIEFGCKIVNAGSGKAYTVYDILRILSEIHGKQIEYSRGETEGFWSKYPEIFSKPICLDQNIVAEEIEKMSRSDIQVASEKYNWSPTTDMRVGLEACYQYAKELLK